MDELTVNDLGVDSALDLAVSREALTKSIEKEITAVKLSDESATDLAEVRERLIKELEKQGPVIDYAKELSEQQLALIDSLKRQTQSAESVAKANDEQASAITKQTAGIVKVSNQSTQQFKKQSTLLGNIAGKALQSFTGSIADTLSGVLDDLPGIQQAKQVSSFTKSVMPTKAKEKPAKRIQSVSKRERMKCANVAPEKTQNAPESFTDAFKRRDEQGAGRNSRLMLKHLENIDKTSNLILEEVKGSTLLNFLMKAMMMSAVVGLGKILTGLPASLAASLAKTIASKFPSPSSGKTDPKKAEPKTDPKKSEKTKPQPEPAKTDPTKKADPTKQPETAKTEPKPKTETKPQPKPEPAVKTDIPKTEPAKPTTSPKPTTPNPASETGKITKAGGKVSGMFEKAGKGLSRVAKGIPFLGSILFGADVINQQMNDPRDAGLSHAQAIMAGEQDNYKGTYQPKPEPMKMERAEPPLSAEGERLDAKAEKERQEEKKEVMKTQALMAQAVHSTATNIQNTTVNNISGGSGGGGSYVHPFGNDYQTPHQKGSMIQR